MDLIQLANYLSVEYFDSKTVTFVKFRSHEAVLVFDDKSTVTVNGLFAQKLRNAKP